MLVKYYEGKNSVSAAGYNECDVKEIIDYAASLPLYAKHRDEAVRFAYIRWNTCKKNGLEISEVPYDFAEEDVPDDAE